MEPKEFDKGWIVGFIESEGVFTVNTIKSTKKTKFGVRKYKYVNPAFYLVSRDISALEVARGILRMGKINQHGRIFHLDIRRKSETARLANFLKDRLKSELRKRQFEAWASRILEWKSRARGHGVDLAGKAE
jgi:hypothetical protein